MLNIINDIISISKIESQQIEVSVSETNVNEQVEYIYHFFRLEAEQKKLHISFKNKLPMKEAEIRTDREKLYAVLTNLVKNAVKFTETGTIEMGYFKKDGFLEFYVKDTGPGIPEEQKELIFERFRQGNDSYTRNYEGAGLGLSISKAYV
jgi:signal transduction histidine kinase